MDQAEMLSRIEQGAWRRSAELNRLAEDLACTPEPGYKEYKTQARLIKAVADMGMVAEPFQGITGFQAVLDTGRTGPNLAVLCELDAIDCPGHPRCDPITGLAHACGHHLAMAAAIGAMTILLDPAIRGEMCGKVTLMAVPAEEYTQIEAREAGRKAGSITFYGGKQECIARGLFNQIQMGLMVHALAMDAAVGFGCGMAGFMTKSIRLLGRAAHAAGAPEQGVNALAAIGLGMSALNALRETFRDEDHVRVHGILTHGGEAINTIPAEARAEIMVRAANEKVLGEISCKVDRAFGGGAYALGATVYSNDAPGYLPLLPDEGLTETGMRVAGELFGQARVRRLPFNCASTDLGDLGALMPVIQPYIGGCSGGLHSREFMVTDPECCANGAAVLAGMAATLLMDGGAAAKKIIADYHPLYPDSMAYTIQRRRLFAELHLTPLAV